MKASSRMAAMASRRMEMSSPDRSLRWLIRSAERRSSTGMTRSLQTMVERAMVSTMTMPLPAESPPRKASSVSPSACSAIGTASTK
jgi:hypothetical protein